MEGERSATVCRTTRETDISLTLKIDGAGRYTIRSGVPFFDHMLSHIVVHALFDLDLTCRGDTEVDDHHTVEDIGIALGQALAQAMGDKAGIARYGSILMPMDEALVLVALDVSGRGLLVYDVPLNTPKVGRFDTELVPEFLRAFAHHAGITLHVQCLHEGNTHHLIEAIFKGLGRTLRQALAHDPRRQGIPSTKGVL